MRSAECGIVYHQAALDRNAILHSAVERPVGAFGVSDVANRRHGLFLPADLRLPQIRA